MTGLFEEEKIDPTTGLPIEKPEVQSSAEMNPIVRDYISKKYNLGDYSPDKRAALVESNNQAGDNVAGQLFSALAGFGSAGAGRGFEAGYHGAQGAAKSKTKNALDAFDTGRKNMMVDVEFQNAQRDDKMAQERLARESDPMSIESKMAQDLAKSMGMNPDQAMNLTAAKFKEFSPALQKKYEIAQKSLDRKDAAQTRRDELGVKNDEKKLARDEKKKAAIVEIEDRRRNIEDNLKLVEDMIKDKGTYEAFGSHNSDLDRRVDMIATDMAKLADPGSVARPQEVEQFKKGLVSASATGMRNSTALDVLKNFRAELGSRAANAYSIRGLENPGSSEERLASRDKEAIEWAQANPDDPRAAQILEANGIKDKRAVARK